MASRDGEVAQESKKDPPAKGPEYIEVTVYYAVVVGDGTIEGADKEVPIGGPYHTPEEADARCAQWDEEKMED